MASPAPTHPDLRIPSARGAVHRAWAVNRPLTFVGLLMLVTLVIAAIGLVADPRVITGDPAWLKPAKFAISIAVYCFTLLWLLTFVRGRERAVALVSWVIATALTVEMALIAGAAAAGTTSHFNFTTPLSTAVWMAMGGFIVLVWLMHLLAIVLLLIQRLSNRAFAWSLRLGLVVSAVGMAVAFLMTDPTTAQLTTARAGGGMTIVGAHSVGVPDGGAGLPITGWSTVGGDLRVPHFLGLHGLQVLPLVGFLVARFGRSWLRSSHQIGLVWTAGLTYLGLVVISTWQALRGQSVIAPDAATLAALLTLVAVAGTVGSFVVAHARGTATRSAPTFTGRHSSK